MTRIEEIEQEVLELTRKFISFSGKAGDWARALVNVESNENLPISAESPFLVNIPQLTRLEILQLLVNGEPERLRMVDHSQEWGWLKKWKEEWKTLLKIQELETEVATHLASLRTSQEWHERQKAEIIAEWSNKYQTLIQKWKSSLTHEIQLIKEALHD